MCPNASTTPFPIGEGLSARLDSAAREHAERVARALRGQEPRPRPARAFGDRVSSGVGPAPSLFLEDHHEIRLFESLGNHSYSYRALLLAGSGDQVAIGVGRTPAFERYCAETLGLGEPEILVPGASNPGASLAGRCARDPGLLDRVSALASGYGELNVIPYMGTGGVWALAGAIAERSGARVRVAAPLPWLTRCTNDKIWFGHCVERLLGSSATPRSWAVPGSAMLASRVASLARRHATLVVKVPDSASSKGNLVLDARSVEGQSLAELREWLLRMMARSGWRGLFPVQLAAWEQPVLASPSAHLWIPQPSDGDPIVEGIFEQRLIGRQGLFAGAAPSALPCAWQERIAGEALLIGILLQNLGYFGRCSFDAILVGAELDAAVLHWLECNGRWGGVSLPMTLAARLFGDWRRQPFVIADRRWQSRSRHDVADILDALQGQLYVCAGAPVGCVILSPSPLEAGTGYEIMVFADSTDSAVERCRRLGAYLEQLLQS